MFPLDKLHEQHLRYLVYLCQAITISGLAPYDKLLLLLLVQLDPLAQGITLSWREIIARTKLSLSSCQRAAERLQMLQLISIQRKFSEHREPGPSTFFHLLNNQQNPLLNSTYSWLLQSEFLDNFLEMRAGFEEALKNRIEETHPGKSSSRKKQARSSLHSPRAWRQTFGPISEDGEALQRLSTYQTKGRNAEPSKEHICYIATYCLRGMIPQGTMADILKVTPKQCLEWIEKPR